MVLKRAHTTPMLNSTSLSKSSWPWFHSTYFCFCIWSIYCSPCKSVLWNKGTPKANGGKTRSKPNLQSACFTEMQIHTQCCQVCKTSSWWRPSVRYTEGSSRSWRSLKMSFLQHLEVVLSQNTWFPIGWQKIMLPSTARCILEKEIRAATLSSFVHMGGNAMVEWFATFSSRILPMHWSQSMAWMDWMFAKTFLHHRMLSWRKL